MPKKGFSGRMGCVIRIWILKENTVNAVKAFMIFSTKRTSKLKFKIQICNKTTWQFIFYISYPEKNVGRSKYFGHMAYCQDITLFVRSQFIMLLYSGVIEIQWNWYWDIYGEWSRNVYIASWIRHWRFDNDFGSIYFSILGRWEVGRGSWKVLGIT